MNSESVKPLLSAEEMHDNHLADWRVNSHTVTEQWLKSLKEMESQYASLQPSSPQLEQEVKRLQDENEELKTVMIAAAEEIKKHWEAICGLNGYGPSNLLNRLEKGIPAHYGYTAGSFCRLKSRIEELEQELSQVDTSALYETTLVLYRLVKAIGTDNQERQIHEANRNLKIHSKLGHHLR